MMRGRLAVLFGTLAALAVPGVAQAATLTVDDDHKQCATAGYTTIQAAVDAANDGDSINVCRGTYNESVHIEKNDLKLQSITAPLAAVVKAPPTPPESSDPSSAAFVVDGGSTGVQILRFRIEGDPGGDGGIFGEGNAGIFVAFAHVALIRENLIVGGGAGVVSVGSIDQLRENTILGYQSVGIFAFGFPSCGCGDDDVMTTINAQNNTLTGTEGSTGIVFFGLLGPVDGLLFANSVSKNGYDGIALVNARVGVKSNKSFLNGRGLSIDSFDIGGPAVTAAPGGAVALDEGPRDVANNQVTNNTGDGIVAAGGGNLFNTNNARANGGIDCVDETDGPGTAGTDNIWTLNLGYDANRPGICAPGAVVGPTMR